MGDFDRKRVWKATSYNKRFGKMAGVFPLKCSEKLVTACYIGTSVRPATSPSRHHVSSNAWATQRFDNAENSS